MITRTRFNMLLLGVLLAASATLAFSNIVLAGGKYISTPSGNVYGETYIGGGAPRGFSSGGSAGSHYYLRATTRLWGACGSGETGCSYGWRVKASDSKTAYNSSSTAHTYTSSVIWGHGISFHEFQKLATDPYYSGFTDDDSNLAKALDSQPCYNQGPHSPSCY